MYMTTIHYLPCLRHTCIMLKFANAIIDCEGGDEFVTASRSLHCGVRSVVHILHICIMGGLGESTNGSDPKYINKQIYEYTNMTIHIHDNLWGEMGESTNGSNPICTYCICNHNKQQVKYVQYLFIINKHTQ